MCPDFRSDDVRVAGEEVDLGVAGEEDNRLTGDGAEEVGLESFGLKSQKLPESSETENKITRLVKGEFMSRSDKTLYEDC